MAFDKKAYQKEYAAKWYKKNKELTLQRTRKSNKKNIKRNKDFVREIKEASPCVDCRSFISSLYYGF